jgi:hypothetical protein
MPKRRCDWSPEWRCTVDQAHLDHGDVTNFSRVRDFNMTKTIIILSFGLALSGCATEAYRAAADQCSPAAYAQYPVINQQKMEMRTRSVQVPTGQTKCTSTVNGNKTDTTCTDITRTEYQQYPVYVTVDINEDGRDKVIAACARDRCLKTHGNPDCE